MGAIQVHEIMILDGVINAPTWTFDYGFDPRMAEAIGGYRTLSRHPARAPTYEMFQPAWSTQTVEDDPGAAFFNDATKYVTSATLTTATWRNSQIVGPYAPDAIRSLKDEVDGGLYVSGSDTLVRAMLAGRPRRRAAPVRLPAHPRTRAAALPEQAAPHKLSLAASETYENDVVYLAHRPQA